jgi:hypothetical protein
MSIQFLAYTLLLLLTCTPATSVPTRSVLIFRHCLRSTPTSGYGAPGYSQFDNYSTQPTHHFPAWPVPVYQCLPHGIDLVQAAGRQLSASFPTPVIFKVDTTAKRDNDTANALLHGMGSSQKYQAAPALFNPVGQGLCPKMNKGKAIAALKARFDRTTVPSGHKQRLKHLQDILGKGVAPSIPEIPDSVLSNGYFTGGSSIASEFAEAFLMQWGGKLPTAWGEITTVEDIYDLLSTHIYYRGINDRVLSVVARSHSMMTNAIIQHLKSGTGTLILVGHDSDLDALGELFGLSWHTAPFPPNATTPGSALRFDLTLSSAENENENENIAASIHYQNFNGSADVQTVPAMFQWSTENMPSLMSIDNYLKTRLDPACM